MRAVKTGAFTQWIPQSLVVPEDLVCHRGIIMHRVILLTVYSIDVQAMVITVQLKDKLS